MNKNINFLSSVLVLCVFGITGAEAAPSVRMLGANAARVGTNTTVVKSDNDSNANASSARLGTIRSKVANVGTPITAKKVSTQSGTTGSADARLSLGKYIHSTGVSAGTIKPATAGLPGAEVSSSDFVSLSDHVRDLEKSLEGYYTKDEIDDKVADIVVGDMDDVFSGKQDTIEDLENIRSGAAAGATAVQPAALADYATTSALDDKQDKIDSAHKLSADLVSGLDNYATVEAVNAKADASALSSYATTAALGGYYTKAEVDSKVAEVAAGDLSGALEGKQDKIDEEHKLSADLVSGLDNYATTSALADYATVEALNSKLDSSALDDYLTTAGAAEAYQPKGNYLTEHQDISGLISNPELPEFSGDYLLKVNVSNNGNYTYSWAKASDYSGGGSGSGGSSGGSNDDCDPNWEVCD